MSGGGWFNVVSLLAVVVTAFPVVAALPLIFGGAHWMSHLRSRDGSSWALVLSGVLLVFGLTALGLWALSKRRVSILFT